MVNVYLDGKEIKADGNLYLSRKLSGDEFGEAVSKNVEAVSKKNVEAVSNTGGVEKNGEAVSNDGIRKIWNDWNKLEKKSAPSYFDWVQSR